MVVPVVVLVTTPDHVVDHKWSVGVPELSLYKRLSKGVIFQGEHVCGAVGRNAGDH